MQLRIGAGLLAKSRRLLRAFDHRLENEFAGNGGRGVQRGGDLSRIGGDFFRASGP